MIKTSQLTKEVYKLKEIATHLGVSTKTLQRWDKEGIVSFRRDGQGKWRFLTRQEFINLLDKRGLLVDDRDDKRRDVIYARVSSHEQKTKGDLDRQALFLAQSVPDLHNPLILSEVGSGLNDKRKKLQQLLTMVCAGKVDRVFITYRDRLTRFGFHYLETIFSLNGTQIVVVKQQSEAKSVEQELTEDLMALVASFSGKLYGLRSRKNKKEAEK